MITVLAGGVGAARFLRGLVDAISPLDVTAIVNTGDDSKLHGLDISPDIDTVIYTLADAIDRERGWGLSNETWTAMSAVKRYVAVRPANSTAASDWFNLGDHDLATHFYRTARLAEGATLSEVTTEIATAWEVDVRIMPMSNDRVATRVTLAQDCEAGTAGSTIGFQEYFVKYRHSVAVSNVEFVGADFARPLALGELSDAEMIVIAPSNPIVSIGPIRALSGVDAILSKRRSSVVAISPIVAGAALKGPADRMMVELGHQATVVGVAKVYAPICGTLVIDTADAHLASQVEAQDMRCIVTNTVMSDRQIAKQLAQITLGAGR